MQLFNVLQEVNTVGKIVHYENSDFEKIKLVLRMQNKNLERYLKVMRSSHVKLLDVLRKKILKRKKKHG